MSETLAELADDLRRITAAEFNAMVRQGVFDDEHVELIDGVIVTVAAEGGPHIRVVMWLTNHFARALGEERLVGVSHPYTVDAHNQPQPDLAVVAVDALPSISDALDAAELVVEVAHTSRRRDLLVKSRLYAQAGVPVYWVVDLVERQLVIHTDPERDGYATTVTRGPDDTVEVLGVTVDLGALFALA